jgi:hypothetical protein
MKSACGQKLLPEARRDTVQPAIRPVHGSRKLCAVDNTVASASDLVLNESTASLTVELDREESPLYGKRPCVRRAQHVAILSRERPTGLPPTANIAVQDPTVENQL